MCKCSTIWKEKKDTDDLLKNANASLSRGQHHSMIMLYKREKNNAWYGPLQSTALPTVGRQGILCLENTYIYVVSMDDY